MADERDNIAASQSFVQGPRSYFESGGDDKWLKVVGLKHFLLSNSLWFSKSRRAPPPPRSLLGKYQPQTPVGITVKVTLPNLLWPFEHPKANISQHYPNNVGSCWANMLCSFARGLKHMIWKFQNAGIIFIFSYVWSKNFLYMGSNTGKSDFTILQLMCYAIVYLAALSLAL